MQNQYPNNSLSDDPERYNSKLKKESSPWDWQKMFSAPEGFSEG